MQKYSGKIILAGFILFLTIFLSKHINTYFGSVVHIWGKYSWWILGSIATIVVLFVTKKKGVGEFQKFFLSLARWALVISMITVAFCFFPTKKMAEIINAFKGETEEEELLVILEPTKTVTVRLEDRFTRCDFDIAPPTRVEYLNKYCERLEVKCNGVWTKSVIQARGIQNSIEAPIEHISFIKFTPVDCGGKPYSFILKKKVK